MMSSTDFLLLLILIVCLVAYWEIRAIRKHFTGDE